MPIQLGSQENAPAWIPHLGGRLSTVDLLVLTSLDNLLLTLETLFTFLQNKLSQLGGLLY